MSAKMKVEFYRHPIGEDEILSVSEVLRGIFLTTGHKVAEFESAFAQYLNAPHVVGLSSCTAALKLAFRCLNIGKGDEIITTPLTFVATANAILESGAAPVFVDVEDDTGLIDVEKIEKAITARTKAIVPVHLYGQMCDMRALYRLKEKYGVALIEDAAHCIEGMRDGVRPGQLSDAACFSFYATKNITSGEGGAIALSRDEWLSLLQKLRNHGMTQDASLRYSKSNSHWDMEVLGGKYNMNNIQAALLIPQLRKIEKYLHEREKCVLYYRQHLKNIPGLTLLEEIPGAKNAFHLFPVFVDRKLRDKVLFGLRDVGIGVTVNYNPVHLTKYYRSHLGYQEGSFPCAEAMGFSTLSLPLHVHLTQDEQDYVVDSLKLLLQGAVV